MKQRRLASSRGEDRPILRALLRAHIGEIVGIGGRLRRALYEKSDRGGAGRLGGRLAQRIPRRRAAAIAAVRELTSSLPKMLVRWLRTVPWPMKRASATS